MRRTLPLALALAAALTGLIASTAVAADPGTSPAGVTAGAAGVRSPRPVVPPASTASAASTASTAEPVDIAAAVPALQRTFGDRYGGYWIEGEGEGAVVHVGVVAATDDDRAAVAELTTGHPQVVTETVANGYDALAAAADEVASSLDPAAGNFAVGVDVTDNAVVVETESGGAAATREVATEAAERGASEADAPPTEAAGIASGVIIEPRTAIDIAPRGRARSEFPRYEPGLNVTVHVNGRLNGCTAGLLFHNAFGYFGSTAGHCGPLRSGVVMGPHIVDWIRVNGYYPARTVLGDAGLMSMSARRWPAWAVIHTQGGGHRPIIGKLSNAQIAVGLNLCFEGRTSDGNNCGTVARANQTLCCDPAGKAYVYSCTNQPGRPGDSGSPVFQRIGAREARAAGMLSSTVTVGSTRLMCFSTVANLERATGSRAVTTR